MNIELTDAEAMCLRSAFQMYQNTKRSEAAQNKDQDKVKGYAKLLGLIETLQTKIGHKDDRNI